MAGQTIEVALGNPGPSASFEIPPKLVPFVDSVFAEIDNGAGSDTTPTLEVRAPNGDTVAAVPQDAVVPGGDTGRVTWALRLPGRRGGATGTKVAYARAWNNSFSGDPAQTVLAGTSTSASFAHTETTDPSVLSFQTLTNPNDTASQLVPGTSIMYVGSQWSASGPQVTSEIFAVGGHDNAFPHLPIVPTGNPLFFDGIGNAQSQDFAAFHRSSGGGFNQILVSNRDVADQLVRSCYFVIIYFGTG